MLSVIGEILPLAVGLAVSPTTIIAAILMLVSAHPKATSLAFMIGSIAGILVGGCGVQHPVIGVTRGRRRSGADRGYHQDRFGPAAVACRAPAVARAASRG
jgi:hypothetical protein